MASRIRIPKARQLPSGSWRCEAYRKGKRASFVKDTEEEAVKAAMMFVLQNDVSDEATTFKQKNVTLAEAIDLYVARRDSILSPSTIRGYDQVKRLRFQDVMDCPVGEPHDWQFLINKEHKKGLSAKSISNAWGVVRSVLKENKVPYEAPSLPQVYKKDIQFLQPSQIKPFMEAIRGDRFELAYLLCLHSLRRSEMLALTKANIRDGSICVEGASVVNKDGKLEYKETNKSSASRRKVPIFVKRVQELVDKAPDGGLLVPHAPGNMFSHLQVICKNNDLPILGFHSLRHSFASLCYHLGISEKGCQELGGWDDPNVMKEIYTHIADIDRKNAEMKLKQFFE